MSRLESGEGGGSHVDPGMGLSESPHVLAESQAGLWLELQAQASPRLWWVLGAAQVFSGSR